MQGPRRSMSQQALNQRMDSAQDVQPGQPRRPGIPRSVIAGFDRPLSVIYSAQPSEAAVSPACPHTSLPLFRRLPRRASNLSSRRTVPGTT